MHSRDKRLRRLIAEQAAKWHVAHAEGELSPQQASEFMRWLRTSPAHVAEYLIIDNIARDLSEVACESKASLDDILAEDCSPIRLPSLDAENKNVASADDVPPSRAYRRRGWRHGVNLRRIARRQVSRLATAVAVLIVVFVVAFAGLYWFLSQPTVETFVTRHGQTRSVRLPDDTLVKLDSDSAVTVVFGRTSRRVVMDRGRAYFKVLEDAGRPFSVRVGQSLIRDIGTTFEVYRQAADTTITVATGHVQVWQTPQHRHEVGRWLPWPVSGQDRHGTMLVELGPGEQAKIKGAGQVVSLGPTDVKRAFAWTHGRIAFDSQTVASVAAEFNRYNDVQINVEDRRVGALRISGLFDAHSVSAFTAFLGSLPGVKVETRGQIVTVSAQGRQHQSD